MLKENTINFLEELFRLHYIFSQFYSSRLQLWQTFSYVPFSANYKDNVNITVPHIERNTSQNTDNLIVCSTARSGWQQRTYQNPIILVLYAGKTGEFPGEFCQWCRKCFRVMTTPYVETFPFPRDYINKCCRTDGNRYLQCLTAIHHACKTHACYCYQFWKYWILKFEEILDKPRQGRQNKARHARQCVTQARRFSHYRKWLYAHCSGCVVLSLVCVLRFCSYYTKLPRWQYSCPRDSDARIWYTSRGEAIKAYDMNKIEQTTTWSCAYLNDIRFVGWLLSRVILW